MRLTRLHAAALITLIATVLFAGWSISSYRRIVERGWEGWGYDAYLHVDDGIACITFANDGPLVDSFGNPWISAHWYHWENQY